MAAKFSARRKKASRKILTWFWPHRGTKARLMGRDLPLSMRSALVIAAVFVAVGVYLVSGSFAYVARNAATWNRYAPQIRVCESGDGVHASTVNYRINTGNGYYGAYQMAHATWIGIGGGAKASNAHLAAPLVQDYYAYKLYLAYGFGQWQCYSGSGARSAVNHPYTGPASSTGSLGAVAVRPPVPAPAGGNPYAGVCPAPEATIRNGSSGNCVKKAQWGLNRYLAAGLVVDGSDGPATTAAAKRFQASRGLTADGIIGPLTWSKLR